MVKLEEVTDESYQEKQNPIIDNEEDWEEDSDDDQDSDDEVSSTVTVYYFLHLYVTSSILLSELTYSHSTTFPLPSRQIRIPQSQKPSLKESQP